MNHPIIERIRREIRRRQLTVKSREALTPNMLRLTLTGQEMDGFASDAPDDHIKLFLTDAAGEVVGREYTPRSFSDADRELVVDFALHEAGPATAWAMAAQPGDQIEIGGPRLSRVVGGVTRWLLIGDETALPAIARRVEELGASHTVTIFATIPTPEDQQDFATHADVTTHWVHRPISAAADPAPLLDLLQAHPPAPDTLVWIAAEASVTRALRDWLLARPDFQRSWLYAKGYWTAGKPDATEHFDD